ncbi:MAG: FecR family protein [Terriglobales bacterium]
MLKRKLEIVPVALAALVFSLCSSPSFADSQARIVRLSVVEGTVQIDRNNGQGYEKAFLNLPLTQGVKLRTQDEGRAEVEFEDGSTLRIAPNTVVEFSQLSLLDSGAKASSVNLTEGTAYINFSGAKDDQFILMFGHEKLALNHAAHLRVELSDSDAVVAVFKGDVRVESPSGIVQVGQNHTATFDLRKDKNDKYELARNVEPDPYDDWDKAQNQYQQRYTTTASSSSYSPYAYGMSDMSYYGNFFDAPGYGTMWQPFLTGVGWDPFMDGAWAFNPGVGYGWVSAYPWGWTPYHYGSWIFVPGYGWAWQPGGVWMTAAVLPRVVNPPHNFVAPQPPAAGKSTVVVNRGPVSTVAGRFSNKLVVRNNSAGLGIPRGSLENLTKISQSVQQEGEMTARIHTVSVAPAQESVSEQRGSHSGLSSPQPSTALSPAPLAAPVASHRGK